MTCELRFRGELKTLARYSGLGGGPDSRTWAMLSPSSLGGGLDPGTWREEREEAGGAAARPSHPPWLPAPSDDAQRSV